MTGSHPSPPDGHPDAALPDPSRMTPGEKAVAEWEARHDACARGPHGNPAAVQEYLQRTRSEEHRHPAREPRPAVTAPVEQPTAEPAEAPESSWRHRLLHRGTG